MVTEEQQVVSVSGLNVADALVAIQVIDRAVVRAVIEPREISVVGKTRDALVASVEAAVGINYDQRQQEIRAAAQAQAQAQVAEAAPAQVEAAPAEEQAAS